MESAMAEAMPSSFTAPVSLPTNLQQGGIHMNGERERSQPCCAPTPRWPAFSHRSAPAKSRRKPTSMALVSAVKLERRKTSIMRDPETFAMPTS